MATKLNPDAIQDRSIASIKLQDGVIPSESTVSGWGFTKNTGTITGITMNGVSKGTSGVVDLGTVVTDVSGKADSSAAIGTLSLSINSTNYQITLSGTKVNGTTFTVSDVIDLPLESVVVSGSYDDNTKKVVLTLQNGSTVEFSVADLVAGLQTEITSSNKLSADLIEDGTTNKTVTATEKQTWNSYANVQADWNETTTTEDDYIENKPAIKAGTGTNSIISSDLTNNIASGTNSHADGSSTAATLEASHSEGMVTEAIGYASHSEGMMTCAVGQNTHSEGFGSVAYGQNSHAEGGSENGPDLITSFTISGAANVKTYTTNVAHNLKINDIISCSSIWPYNVSKVTGISNDGLSFNVNNTLSSTALSNASIYKYTSTAIGNFSHSEGSITKAIGSYSHSEGSNTVTNGLSSHAEGGSTTTENDYEHAQGRYNKSNKANSNFGNAGNTLNSIGIGTLETARKNAVEVMQNGDVYVYGVGSYDGTNPTTADTLQDAINNASMDLATPITYSALVTLKTGGNLVPGIQYRITDYNCTTTQANTQCAGHVFDIIVTADSATELNENARAAHHSGDTYFANCDLDAWELKYCLENDTDRFYWADTTNGKGVVYYMKDEWNNECPYDFKNIQFKRYKITACPNSTSLVGKYSLDIYDTITVDTTNPVWSYTFCVIDVDNNILHDVSVEQNLYSDTNSVVGNIINQSYEEIEVDSSYIIIASLPNNVFVTDTDYISDEGFYGFNDNTLENNCFNNTFGSGCGWNKLSTDCSESTFCCCSHNTLGRNCYANIFGNRCSCNTINSGCHNNIFSEYCYNNKLNSGCEKNIFGDEYHNSILGNDCRDNIFGSNIDHLNVFNGVSNCIITGGSSTSSFVQNAQILNGTKGASVSNKLTIAFTANQNYTQVAGLVNGTDLRIWIAEDTVTGPSTSTGNNLAAFDGTTGKVIKDSGVALSSLSNLVHTTGNETITGKKTFTTNTDFKSGVSILNSSGTVGTYMISDTTNDGKLGFYAAQDDSAVQLQNIATPTNNSDAANKSYVDGQVATKYTKPSGGIPSTDLAQAVQTSLGLADTALQSYTETDPVFTASAAYGITSNDITNWNNKTSNVGTITGITMNGVSQGTSGVVNLGTVITSETALSKGTTTGSGNAVTDISVNGHEITLTKGATFLTEELEPDFNNSPAKNITDSQINQWDAKVSANNGTLTIQKNGTQVATFSANQATNQTANIQVNELPSVSASDNGKILMVVDGAWSLVTPVSIYNGTSTPDSSLGENGDIYIQTNS